MHKVGRPLHQWPVTDFHPPFTMSSLSLDKLVASANRSSALKLNATDSSVTQKMRPRRRDAARQTQLWLQGNLT